MKKTLFTFGLLSLTAVVLAGCGASATSKDKKSV